MTIVSTFSRATVLALTLAVAACNSDGTTADTDRSAPGTTRDPNTGTGGTTGNNTERPSTGTTGMADPSMRTGQPAEASGTRVDPNRFVEQAAMGGMFEVRSAELALDRAESDHVQNLARRLREDHTKANTELEETARKLGITVPSTMGPEHERKLQELESLTGEQFETRFLEIQREAHEQTIDLFQRATDQLPDGELSKFAEDKLPILREHLQMAQTSGR